VELVLRGVDRMRRRESWTVRATEFGEERMWNKREELRVKD
jgi:hypothetical protein